MDSRSRVIMASFLKKLINSLHTWLRKRYGYRQMTPGKNAIYSGNGTLGTLISTRVNSVGLGVMALAYL